MGDLIRPGPAEPAGPEEPEAAACPCVPGPPDAITRQKEAEREIQALTDQLQQSQKMESLGRLAGGIAHDMNNILAAIFAVTQSLQFRFTEDPLTAEALAIVERAAQRGKDLIKGLLGFARKERGVVATVDLNELVRREAALLEHTLLQKYQLVVSLEESLPTIQGDPGTLGSALMNLCVNAVDAMPEGGSLGIQTRRGDGGSVQLIVEDTGTGMPPEVVRRAMEPFYTTKPVGKGTGLGLAMVFTTARAHGGTLALSSEEGKGTQVVLTLPAGAAQTGEGSPVERPAPLEAGLNILVVDDDELIRTTTPMILHFLGHKAVAVDGGRAALGHLARTGVPDLVMLDLNMPGLGGEETLRHIRARYPDLPVLLDSGYAELEVERLVASDPATLFITKPFSFEELQRKLGEVGAMVGAKARPATPGGAGLDRQAEPRPGPTLFPAMAPVDGEPSGTTWPTLGKPLAILIIEDNAIDALFIEGLLKQRDLPFTLKRIQTRPELEAALGRGGLDLVLSDYRLPNWNGLEALRQVRAFDPDLPFLFLSGELDEELFVQAIREGANDFLFKDRMLRLVSAIEREVAESRTRWSRRRLEAERQLLHQAIQHSTDWVLLTDLNGSIVYVNPATETISGYAAAELRGQNPRLLKSGRHPADYYGEMWENLRQGQTWQGLITNRRKDGSLWDSHVLISPVRNEQGTTTGYACSGRIEDKDA